MSEEIKTITFTVQEFEKELRELSKMEIPEEVKKKAGFAFEDDPHEEAVNIFPVNGNEYITIHGEDEAKLFIRLLMDHFRIA